MRSNPAYHSVLCVAVLAWLGASPSVAQIAPEGSQLQINEVTTGVQSTPMVEFTPGGGFVVVWTTEESSASDNSGTSISLLNVDTFGVPKGSEIQVNSHLSGDQWAPDVAVGAQGDIMVVWGSPTAPSGDGFFSIQARPFSSNGLPIGNEFRVNTTVANVQEAPSVAAGSGGDFIVVWHSFASAGSDTDAHSIQGQLVASDGSLVGSEVQINEFTSSSQVGPSVAALPTGGFVVTWFNVAGGVGDDNSGRSITARLVDAAALPSGSEFQVNSYTTGNQYNPAVAAEMDGDFVVVWSSNGSPGTDGDYAVIGRHFDSTGSPSGPDFQVNTQTSSVQSMPSIAIGITGEFVVAWRSGSESWSPDGDGQAIAAQVITPSGALVGAELLVNTYATGDQSTPSVSRDGSGRIVIAWQSAGSFDDLDGGVQAQIFGWPFAAVFADGFESGDGNAWSSTVP